MPINKGKTIASIDSSISTCILTTKKPYSQCVKRHRDTINNSLRQSLKKKSAFNDLLEDYGVYVDHIKLKDLQPNTEYHTSINHIIDTTEEYNELTQQQKYAKIAEAKDVCFISDNSYRYFMELTGLDMPTIHRIYALRENLNSLLPKVDFNDYGSFNDCAEQIRYVLTYKIGTIPANTTTIEISLRGDKTNVGRNQGFFNLCFTLPEEFGNGCKSAPGNYPLGLFEVELDDYETMVIALKECVDNLNKMDKKVEVNGKTYGIKWNSAGDMVWLHTERGYRFLFIFNYLF